MCDTNFFLIFLTQETSDKAVSRCFSVFASISDRHKAQKSVIKLFLRFLYNSILAQ